MKKVFLFLSFSFCLSFSSFANNSISNDSENDLNVEEITMAQDCAQFASDVMATLEENALDGCLDTNTYNTWWNNYYNWCNSLSLDRM